MTEAQIVGFLLILTRVSAFVGFFTLFSFRQLPRLVKVGISVGLSVFWYGQVHHDGDMLDFDSLGMLGSTLLFAQEFIIGVMLSIAINLFFMPCKIAGAYIGQEMGLSLAAISNPGTPDSGTLLTRVLESLTILIFFALNVHHFMLITIDYSFKQLAGKIDVLNLPTESMIALLNKTSEHGLMVVGPVAMVLAVVTTSLAILNRVAPSLNLFSIGMSIRTGIGILCLAVFLPAILGGIQSYFEQTQYDIEQLMMFFLD